MNTKPVTSDKSQQVEQERKQNWKYQQGTVISVNESWHQILKYPEVITNLNLVMIQKTSLETRTVKSLRNPDNPTTNNFTQYDANVTNNPKKIVRSPNELRKYFLLIAIFMKVNLKRTKTCSNTRLIVNYT